MNKKKVIPKKKVNNDFGLTKYMNKYKILELKIIKVKLEISKLTDMVQFYENEDNFYENKLKYFKKKYFQYKIKLTEIEKLIDESKNKMKEELNANSN